jgi:hypothetical protein
VRLPNVTLKGGETALPALSCQVWKCVVSLGPMLSRIRKTTGFVKGKRRVVAFFFHKKKSGHGTKGLCLRGRHCASLAQPGRGAGLGEGREAFLLAIGVVTMALRGQESSRLEDLRAGVTVAGERRALTFVQPALMASFGSLNQIPR